jgi:hypothetical protein
VKFRRELPRSLVGKARRRPVLEQQIQKRDARVAAAGAVDTVERVS